MAGTIRTSGAVKEITPILRDAVIDTLSTLHDTKRYSEVPLVLERFELTFSNARAIVAMSNARPGTYEYHCATSAKFAICFAEMSATANEGIPTPPQTAR
jgi:hypothetical protein